MDTGNVVGVGAGAGLSPRAGPVGIMGVPAGAGLSPGASAEGSRPQPNGPEGLSVVGGIVEDGAGVVEVAVEKRRAKRSENVADAAGTGAKPDTGASG